MSSQNQTANETMKTKSLTINQHESIGRMLKDIDKKMIRLSVEISNTYGKTSKTAKTANKASNCVRDLKHLMEEHLFKDCPREATNKIYYGPAE
jgi:hypothetical protein